MINVIFLHFLCFRAEKWRTSEVISPLLGLHHTAFILVLYVCVWDIVILSCGSLQAALASREDPDQLIIALEPEAASIYCRKLRLHQMVDLGTPTTQNGFNTNENVGSGMTQGWFKEVAPSLRRVPSSSHLSGWWDVSDLSSPWAAVINTSNDVVSHLLPSPFAVSPIHGKHLFLNTLRNAWKKSHVEDVFAVASFKAAVESSSCSSGALLEELVNLQNKGCFEW